MTSSNDESLSYAERRGWTPGPWEPTQNRHLQLFVCRADNHDEEVCEVTSGKAEDAHLIAAATDLYVALQDLIAWVEGDLGAELPFDNARAALAEARAQ